MTMTKASRVYLCNEIARLEAELEQARKQATSTASTTSDSRWKAVALDMVRSYRRANPYGMAPLPWLYRALTQHYCQPLTIGQFHDGLRELVEARQLRLHPFTGSFSELVDEKYALLAAQEIKYYAEFID